MSNPPLWVLRQTILPYGARLPKARPLWTPPKPKQIVLPGSNFKRFEPSDLKGNLRNDEYRYWLGMRNEASRWATCRNCRVTVEGGQERIKHKARGCCKVLESCYELLLLDKNCVICDKRTDTTKWGIPLCRGECETRWKFDSYACQALESAKDLVKRI